MMHSNYYAVDIKEEKLIPFTTLKGPINNLVISRTDLRNLELSGDWEFSKVVPMPETLKLRRDRRTTYKKPAVETDSHLAIPFTATPVENRELFNLIKIDTVDMKAKEVVDSKFVKDLKDRNYYLSTSLLEAGKEYAIKIHIPDFPKDKYTFTEMSGQTSYLDRIDDTIFIKVVDNVSINGRLFSLKESGTEVLVHSALDVKDLVAYNDFDTKEIVNFDTKSLADLVSVEISPEQVVQFNKDSGKITFMNTGTVHIRFSESSIENNVVNLKLKVVKELSEPVTETPDPQEG